MRLSVERRLLDDHDPARVDFRASDRRIHPGTQLTHVRRLQQLEVPLALLVSQTSDVRDQRLELWTREGWSVERLEMPPLVLEVALHAHGAKEEPAEVDAPEIGGESKLDRSASTGRGMERFRARPFKSCGLSRTIASGESNAFVRRVGPQCDDAPFLPLDVDLDAVSHPIAIKPGAISLVGGGIVHAGLGEVENGKGALRLSGGCQSKGGERQCDQGFHLMSLMRAS